MAIVVILVVVVAAAGGAAAFFVKSKGSAEETSAPSTAGPTTTSPPATRPSTATADAPAPVAPADRTPATPAPAKPAPPVPPVRPNATRPPVDTSPTTPSTDATDATDAERPVADRLPELEDDDPDGFDLSRFGSTGHRSKDPASAAPPHQPMAPPGRVYDMEVGALDPAPVVDEPMTPEPVAVEPEPAPEPVAVEPEPEPVAVAPEPEPVAVAPEPEPVAVAPEPVAVAPEPEPSAEPVAVEPAPEPVAVAPEPEPEPVAVAPEPEPEPEPTVEPVAVAPEPEPSGDAVIELPRDEPAVAAVAPHDAVDHVLQALIGRAKERQVALAQVAAELVEQANLEDREIDEVLGDLIDLAEDEDTVDPGERLEELTMFNEAVPKRPGQLTDFARLDSKEKKRVIIRVLCLLVALQEDYKLQPQEPASEAETRSWPLARAVWPVKPKAEDDEERNLPGRRRKGKLVTR
jgi:hypothetical protein